MEDALRTSLQPTGANYGDMGIIYGAATIRYRNMGIINRNMTTK